MRIETEHRPFKLAGLDHSHLGGVCGGIAYTLSIPVTTIRIMMVVALLLSSPYTFYIGLPYIAAYVLLFGLADEWTNDPADFEERTS